MTGFGLGADQTLALGRYLDLLLDWRRANVTAVRTRDEAADRLVGDSLALLDVPELETAGRRWLDLGAGAGIPGIPLALARPDVRLTLLDAVGKKCAFLEAAVEVTGLETRAEVVCARSEALASRAGGPAAPAAASGGGRSTTTVTEPTAGGSSGARGTGRNVTSPFRRWRRPPAWIHSFGLSHSKASRIASAVRHPCAQPKR